MVIEIAGVLVESVAAAVSILGEVKRRRAAESELVVLQALQGLDVSSVLAGISNVELAGAMRGALTADLAQSVLNDRQVRRLLSEMVLLAVVEDQETAAESVGTLLSVRISSLLYGNVADDDAQHFAHEVIALAAQFCKKVMEAVVAVNPVAVVSMQQLTVAKRTYSILERIAEQTGAVLRSNSPELKEAREQFIADYRRICAEVHGSIQPPDFETNQRIPLEDLYVAPTIQRLNAKQYELGIDVDDFADHVDRTVVLGDPGGGKSTLSNYLTTRWAREAAGPLPFHVTLREFAPQADSVSILQYIEAQLPSKYQIEPPPGAVADSLMSGEAVVVFDGLDELIDTTKRRSVTAAVETFGIRYPTARLIVTSRRVGYDQARLDPAVYTAYVVDGFDREDVGEYVRKWFASQSAYSDAEAEKLATQFMAQSKAVSDLSSNPLMLSLMCIIFRGENFIPRNRPAIYEKCATLLFEKWDGHRQIEVPLQARDYVDAAMKHVAYLYLESGAGDSGIARSALIAEMANYLYPRAMETRDAAERAAEEFVNFCAGRAWVFSDAGTTADGEPLFTFTHRTFMEYFAAVHLIRISDTPEKLANALLPHIAREEWDVVAQLAVQQSDKSHDLGTERAITTMLRETRKRSLVNRSRVLKFIARCCEFAIVSPAVFREISAASLDFFLTADVDWAERSSSLDPWLALQDFAPEEQLAPIVDAQRDLLREVLDSTDDPRREKAIFILLLGLIRRFNGRIWTSHRSRSEEWDDMFTALAKDCLPRFVDNLNGEPYRWAYVVLGDVVEPGVGIDTMRDQGLSFAECFFGVSTVAGTPIANSVNAAIGMSLYQQVPIRDETIVRGVVERFLSDFADSTGNRHLTLDGMNYRGVGPYLPSVEAVAAAGLDQSHVDFLLLSGFALMELRPQKRPRSEWPAQSAEFGAPREVKASDLDQLGLSPSVLRFAKAWLAEEVSFFDSVTWTNAQHDEVLLSA